MKFLLTLFAALLLASTSFAQAPLRFNYQAVIRNSSGALVSTRPVGMRLSLLQGSATGPAMYVETQTVTTNANGLATLEIGGGTVVSGSLATIAWGGGLFFLKTETDPAGGTNYTITGTSQLLSVPYAIHATYAQFAGGHYVGELFGGGIVFSVWRDHLGVEHGLIASLDDLGNADWAVSAIVSTAIGSSFDDGASNTTAIVAQGAGGSSAAGLCDAYASGLYNDWYLPAIWELTMLYNQAVVVNRVLANDNNPLSNVLGQTGNKRYWSSTRSVDTRQTIPEPTAQALYFNSFGHLSSTNDQSQVTGEIEFIGHNGRQSTVRAIRRF